MNNSTVKKLRREVHKTYDAVEMQFFKNVLSLPFKKRFVIAWRIIRGLKRSR